MCCIFLYLQTQSYKLEEKNVRWSQEATNILKMEFSDHLAKKTYPGFSEIRTFKNEFSLVFAGRSEAQIKSKLSHIRIQMLK